MTIRRLTRFFLFAVVFSIGLARPTDIDLWWHLRTGDVILATGAVPRVDIFSYTGAGRPWVAHEWLWEALAAAIYRRGGYQPLVLISGVIITATFALLYRLIRTLGANEMVATGLVLVAAMLAVPNLGVRPREISFLLLVIYTSQLIRFREGHGAQLWLLPALMVPWVNLHGGFILGIGVLGIFVADAAVAELRARAAAKEATGTQTFPKLLAVAVATAATTAINPAGPGQLLYPFSYYSQNNNPSFSMVSEFQSPDFHEPLMLLFAIAVALWPVVGFRRGQLLDVLLGATLLVQALVSRRQVGVWAVVAAPLFAMALRERFPWVSQERPSARIRPRAALILAVVGALVIGTIVSTAPPRPNGILQLGNEPLARSLPVGGATYVAEHNLPSPVFNWQSWGGYLIYRWYPTRQVFIDGRVDMYDRRTIDDYLTVTELRPDWAKVLEQYGIQTLLIPKDQRLSVMLLADGRWERVYQGAVEDVFVRRRSRP